MQKAILALARNEPSDTLEPTIRARGLTQGKQAKTEPEGAQGRRLRFTALEVGMVGASPEVEVLVDPPAQSGRVRRTLEIRRIERPGSVRFHEPPKRVRPRPTGKRLSRSNQRRAHVSRWGWGHAGTIALPSPSRVCPATLSLQSAGPRPVVARSAPGSARIRRDGLRC